MLSYVYFGTNDLELRLPLQTAEVPKALQACGCITVQTSMQPMYAIRTETKSLPFVVVSENGKEPRHVES